MIEDELMALVTCITFKSAEVVIIRALLFTARSPSSEHGGPASVLHIHFSHMQATERQEKDGGPGVKALICPSYIVLCRAALER